MTQNKIIEALCLILVIGLLIYIIPVIFGAFELWAGNQSSTIFITILIIILIGIFGIWSIFRQR